MGHEALFETLKLNKMDKDFWRLWRKFEYIIYDVNGDGKWFSFKKNKKGKEKLTLCKERKYMVKKPKWKKM